VRAGKADRTTATGRRGPCAGKTRAAYLTIVTGVRIQAS